MPTEDASAAAAPAMIFFIFISPIHTASNLIVYAILYWDYSASFAEKHK